MRVVCVLVPSPQGNLKLPGKDLTELAFHAKHRTVCRGRAADKGDSADRPGSSPSSALSARETLHEE